MDDTYSCGRLPATGDFGQRFEVTYFDPSDDARKVMGWSETAEGAQRMADSIEKHPSWSFPQIRDRQGETDG